MSATDIRPMSLGEVLDRTFSLYKGNFLLLTGIMAVPMVFKLAYSIGIEWFQRMSALAQAGRGPSLAVIMTGAAGAFILALFTWMLQSAATAGTIVAVSETYLGRRVTVSEAYRPVRKRIFRLMLLLLATGLLCGLGFILLIIPGIILLCRTAVVTPVMMLEDEDVGGSISRSMELTKGFAFQVFLIFLLVWVISVVAGMLVAAPITFAITAMKLKTIPFYVAVLQHLATFVVEVLVTPIGSIAFSLMYYNLRVRKEAFDLQHLMTSLGESAGPGNAPSLA